MRRTFSFTLTHKIFVGICIGVLLTAFTIFWFFTHEREEWMLHNANRYISAEMERFFKDFDALPNDQKFLAIMSARRRGLLIHSATLSDLIDIIPNTAAADAMQKILTPARQVVSVLPDSCETITRYLLDRATLHDAKNYQDDEWFFAQRQRSCESFLVSDANEGFLHVSSLMQPLQSLPTLLPYKVSSQLIGFGLLLALILLFFSYLIARFSTISVRKLAKAADDLGRNIDCPALVVYGESEVRKAINAFNTMQKRIQNQLRERTDMIGAITHDLQTPLTRIRLRIEKIQDTTLKNQRSKDLAHTQEIVQEGLEWAKSRTPLSNQPLLLSAVIEELGIIFSPDDLQIIAPDFPQTTQIWGHPVALQRVLQNVIQNAIRYGHPASLCFHSLFDHAIEMWVEDCGEGIPPDLLEKVFEPYYRLETSRSRDGGGSGLGLSIARNLLEAMGGSIILQNRPQRGLRVVIKLQTVTGHGSS